MVTASPAASSAARAKPPSRRRYTLIVSSSLVQLAFRDFIVCACVYQVGTTVSVLCHETIHLATDSGSSAKPSLTP